MTFFQFFQDDKGHLHRGRLLAVLSTVGLIWGCGAYVYAPLCLSRAGVVAGIWLFSFDKRQSGPTFSDLARPRFVIEHPQKVIGIVLSTGSLIAGYFFLGPHPLSGR
jgi:hypothetical protein